MLVRGVEISLVVPGLSERIAQPLQSFVEAISGCGASGLDILYPMLAGLMTTKKSSNPPKRVVADYVARACQ